MIPGRGTSVRDTGQSRRDRSDLRDGGEDFLAIQGNFIPVSGSGSPPSPSCARQRSPSPRRRQVVDQGVHLHLSLTDTQMEKLTSAFSAESPQRKSRGGDSAKGDNLPPAVHAGGMDSDESISRRHHFNDPFATPGRHHRGEADRAQREARGRVDGSSRAKDNERRPARSGSPSKRSRSPAKGGDDYRALSPSSMAFSAIVVDDGTARQRRAPPASADGDDNGDAEAKLAAAGLGRGTAATASSRRRQGQHQQAGSGGQRQEASNPFGSMFHKGRRPETPPSQQPIQQPRRMQAAVSPGGPTLANRVYRRASMTSSVYSSDDGGGQMLPRISPLRIAKTPLEAEQAHDESEDNDGDGDDGDEGAEDEEEEEIQEAEHEEDEDEHPNLLRDYAEWVRACARQQQRQQEQHEQQQQQQQQQHQQQKQAAVAVRDNSGGGNESDNNNGSSAAEDTGVDGNRDIHARKDVYSPLHPFMKSSEHHAGKGRKVMVGYNGWLERTDREAEKKASPPKKGGGLFDVFKRVARDVAEMTDIKAARRAKEAERKKRTSRVTISLDPREQSLLYCELEFILTSALHGYINGQFNAGRLDADRYKKIADAWQHKGRPKVVGFRYDLETQLDLVHLHLQHFKFYGDRSGVAAAVAATLDMMKVNARALRIRTFCQPDSVVAKQLLDSQSLLAVLGCPEPQQIQLAEVVQFFKTILERQQHFRRETAITTTTTAAITAAETLLLPTSHSRPCLHPERESTEVSSTSADRKRGGRDQSKRGGRDQSQRRV